MTDIKQLTESLRKNGKKPVLAEDGTPMVARNAIPGQAVVHPARFVKELEKEGKAIDPISLVITKKDQDKTQAAPEPPSTDPPKPPYGNAKGKPDGVPPGVSGKPADKPDTYTKAELEHIGKGRDGYKCLQKIAGADPEVPGNISRVDLIEQLTGRPKFPLK